MLLYNSLYISLILYSFNTPNNTACLYYSNAYIWDLKKKVFYILSIGIGHFQRKRFFFFDAYRPHYLKEIEYRNIAQCTVFAYLCH